MNFRTLSHRVATLGVAFVALTGFEAGAAQMQAQAPTLQGVMLAPAQIPAQPQSACGNQPLCTDTPEFVVVVNDFRLSMSRYGKTIDATLRFLNKTNQPLILGYVDNTAAALDDQGNRYGPLYNFGLTGIGLVAGNGGDPKFALQPGGAGDAHFNSFWRPGPQDPIGNTFELEMTIREITTLPGGQHSLGGEFPLHFRGLANGVTGGSPAYSNGMAGGSSLLASGSSAGASSACGPSGAISSSAGATNSAAAQDAATTATSTVSNAAAAFSSLKSIFGGKKAAVPSVPGVPAAVPCVPANPSPAGESIATSAANPAAPQANTGTVPAVNSPASAAAKSATTAGGRAAAAPAQPAKAARQPVPVTAKKVATPVNVKKPATTAPPQAPNP